MPIHAAACDVFMLLLADTAASATGSSGGMYLTDNRSGEGSQREGTANLVTTCATGATICWRALPILPCSGDSVVIQSIGNGNAWGSSGQPEPAPDLAGAFTGQAQNAGAALAYSLGVLIKRGSGSLVQPSVSPQIVVKGAAAITAQSKPAARTATLLSTSNSVAPSCPDTMIVVAIDANRFRASAGASGAYLADNRAAIGSTGEGTPRLRTLCNAGDSVGFGVVSIALSDGYSVTLAGIDVSAGPIFPAGHAPKVTPSAWWPGAAGSYWNGKAVNTGGQTYRLTVRLDDGVAPYTATITASIRCR